MQLYILHRDAFGSSKTSAFLICCAYIFCISPALPRNQALALDLDVAGAACGPSFHAVEPAGNAGSLSI